MICIRASFPSSSAQHSCHRFLSLLLPQPPLGIFYIGIPIHVEDYRNYELGGRMIDLESVLCLGRGWSSLCLLLRLLM